MNRWFNIAGPCFPREHYMIPPERRVGEAMTLIAQGRWFSLVSGRQTGKTTLLRALAKQFNAGGTTAALWIDLEEMRVLLDAASAFRTLFTVVREAFERVQPGTKPWTPEEQAAWLADPTTAVRQCFRRISELLPGVVLLLDEADVLVGEAMVSFLTQLRALYLARDEQPAPRSVVLAGVKAVRDYATSHDDRDRLRWLGTASPFNVTVENVGLAPFSEAEVCELTAQHTSETGQRFEAEANARVYELSCGHPWLVNALCDQCTRRDVTDRSVAITAAHIEAAKETLILERRTHIDSLVARLREERVRRVLDPMIAGERAVGEQLDDDFAYVRGLGLIAKIEGTWQPANRIYREIIPRVLTLLMQEQLALKTAWYVDADGLLDATKLMAAWQEFWRKDGHLAADGFSYKESGPHLMLMAFLQRIVNGGGRIDREYALGKGALDLLVTWKTQRIAIEVKLRRDTETEDEAIEQVVGYLQLLDAREGWLILFDLRSTAPWSQRLFTREHRVDDRLVRVVGC